MGHMMLQTLAEIADKMKALDPVVDRIVCHESVVAAFRRYLADITTRKTCDMCGVKVDVVESEWMPHDKVLCLDRTGKPVMVIDVQYPAPPEVK